MDTAFEFELAVRALPADLEDDLFEALEHTLVPFDDFDLPALPFGEAAVHSEEIGGEQ